MGVVYGNSYYEVVNGAGGWEWDDAESAAQSLGGNLITINTLDEWNWFKSEYTYDKYGYSEHKGSGSFKYPNGEVQLWVGVNDAANEGTFVWSSGESIDVSLSDINFTQGGTPSSDDYGLWQWEQQRITTYNKGYQARESQGWPSWANNIRGVAEIPLSFFSISDATVSEGSGGTVTITRTDATTTSQTLQVLSSDSSANAADYTAINTTISFAAGESTKTINFSTTSDDITEGDEAFNLAISAEGSDAVPPQFLDSTATVTINDSSSKPMTPNLVTATLKGAKITLQFDTALSDTLPSTSRFTLNQSNRQYQIVDTEVRAFDGIVTLTAEKELDPTVSLTLDYSDFAGDQTLGVIESTSGVDLESFSGFALNNQGSQANTLTIDEGEYEGNQISLFLSAPISKAVPLKSRFKVKSANKKQKILGVSTEPDEGIVTLTTKNNLDLQESILVSYRDLSGDQVDKVIEDLAGNDMNTIKDFEITSGGNDAIAPLVASATLDENTLAVEFDSIIRNTSISKNRFKVKADGKRVKVLSATVEQDDSYVELALRPKNLGSIDINSSVTLAYKDPKGDQTSKVVEDIFGNDLVSFSGYGVEIVKI